QADKIYVYRVSASGTPTGSGASSPLVVVMPPADPSNVQAALNGSRVTVTWQDYSATESGYMIQRKVGKNGTNPPGQDTYSTLTSTASGGTYTDTAIQPGTQYAYRVLAIRIVSGSP